MIVMDMHIVKIKISCKMEHNQIIPTKPISDEKLKRN